MTSKPEPFQRGPASPPTRSVAPLLFLIILSGVSALIYQVLWLRMLAVVFGVTVYAATAVLASFMGGLALGSALAGRLADRVRSPLRWFGLVEVAIGLLAFSTQWLLAAATPVYIHVQAWLPDGLLAQTAVRFLGSFLVLLGPATLMGMTLPLAVKGAASHAAHSGRRISLLYAGNTLGAVVGALVAGFYLVGVLGLGTSFRLAAVMNVLVGLAACLLPAADAGARTQPPRGGEPIGTADLPPRARLPRTAFAVFALSGFGALALEVVWFRALVYFVPATTYAFSTMLAAVLLGLAAGSFAATPLLARSGALLERLAWLQLATSLAVPLAATGLALAYGGGWHPAGDVYVSMFLAFPPAFLMGMSYPIGLQAWAGRDGSHGTLDATGIGDLNSINLIGGIVGAIAGGFFILPALGSRRGLVALGAVYLVSFFLLMREIGRPVLRRVSMVIAPAAFVLIGINVPDLLVMSARRYPPGERLFWRQEGAQTTAAVRIRPLGGRFLYLNGLHQASDAPEMVKLHRLIGHLPMALHPNPARAVVIGMGGGATPGAVSQHDTAVDLIELSRSVVEASAWFTDINYDVLRRPNVRLRIEDGRNFLQTTATRYDVVTADLIQPEHAGAGNLYSVEYFDIVRRALAPRGLVLQWIGRRPETEYHLILRTFLQVFPGTTLWADGQLLVGSVQPLVFSRAAFERKLQGGTQQALEDVGLASFERLLGLYVAGPDELRTLVGSGPILTDDRPALEYFRSLPADGRRAIDLSPLRGDVSRHVQ